MSWDLELLLVIMIFHRGITTPAHSGGITTKSYLTKRFCNHIYAPDFLVKMPDDGMDF